MNILDYLDSLLMSKNSPDKFILPKEKVIELEALAKSQNIDSGWMDFKTDGIFNNYRGIPIEIKENNMIYLINKTKGG